MPQDINQKLDNYLKKEKRASGRKKLKAIGLGLLTLLLVLSFYILDRASPTGITLPGIVTAVVEVPTAFTIKGYGVPERFVTIKISTGQLIYIPNNNLERGQRVLLHEEEHRLTHRMEYRL